MGWYHAPVRQLLLVLLACGGCYKLDAFTQAPSDLTDGAVDAHVPTLPDLSNVPDPADLGPFVIGPNTCSPGTPRICSTLTSLYCDDFDVPAGGASVGNTGAHYILIEGYGTTVAAGTTVTRLPNCDDTGIMETKVVGANQGSYAGFDQRSIGNKLSAQMWLYVPSGTRFSGVSFLNLAYPPGILFTGLSDTTGQFNFIVGGQSIATVVTAPITFDEWHCLEIDLDRESTATGSVKISVDSVSQTFSNLTTETGDLGSDDFIPELGIQTTSGSTTLYWDNLIISTTPLGCH
jgi:hypothetical protein